MDSTTASSLPNPKLESSWKSALKEEFAKPSFAELKAFLQAEKKAGHEIFPAGKLFFNALNLTPVDKVSVVILGQDPYHGQGQAMGLSFSVPQGVKIPPSLQNIFKEQQRDLCITQPGHGDLTAWAKQGVLLLNTVLSVRAGEANSHRNKGWEVFTNAIIHHLSSACEGLVFMLWGNPAKEKLALIDENKHCVVTSVHPSPLSAHRGFLGCGHFSTANEYLFAQKKAPINWQLPAV